MKLITANRLLDGAVVYRTAAGGWSPVLAEAARFEAAEAPEALAAACTDVLAVINPYLVLLEGDGFGRRERVRERIRAEGPSVPYRQDQGRSS